ncbi:MAG: hypothetical protein ACR2QC_10705 [Gammaproteobacteria bacterium]
MKSERIDGRNDSSPIIIATGGALVGAGMGFGIPGAIIGGIIGLWAGIASQKEEEKRAHRD